MAVRSRGRRAGGLVLFAVLVLLILGRGLGLWTGGAGGDAGGDVEGDGLAPRSRAASSRAEETWKPAAPAASAAPAAPAGGETEAPAPGGEAGTLPFDDERSARCAFARHALADGRIADALAALDGQPVRDPDVAALHASAAARLEGACSVLAERLRAGEVHQAQAVLLRMLEPRHAVAVAALDRWTAAHSLPSLTVVAAGKPSSPAQQASALALRDRTVRLRGEGPRVRVVAETAAGVTVRAVGQGGVTFPTVPAYAVEPEGVTAAEAAELGLLAHSAGEDRIARLWCICGLLRAPSPPERLARLRAML
jgi:hypothetical protein